MKISTKVVSHSRHATGFLTLPTPHNILAQRGGGGGRGRAGGTNKKRDEGWRLRGVANLLG